MPFLQNQLKGLPDSSLAVVSSKKFELVQNQLADKIDDNSQEPVKYFWIRAPKAMVYNQNFSDGAKLLYLILLDYQGRNSYAFPSLETLARDTGKSIRRVQQLLKELEAGEAIEIVAQPGWVNLYRVGLPPSELASNSTPENTNAVCNNSSAGNVNSNNPTELASRLNDKTSGGSEQKNVTPMKDFAFLPMQKSSSELDAVKLKNTVCKKSRIAPTAIATLGNTVNTEQPTCDTPNYSQSLFTAKNRTFNHDKLRPEPNLTDDQSAIAKILRGAGVATLDAERIALTNPKPQDVQGWIELAATKANPGGYLAVVLSKIGATPPPLPNDKTLSSGNSSSSKKSNKSQYPTTWQQRNKRTHNQQAGVLAYVQKHKAELEKWQSQQLSSRFQESDTIASSDVSALGNIVKKQDEREPNGFSTTNSDNTLESHLESADNSAVVSLVDSSNKNRELTNDSKLRLLIRQLDKPALQYLKQARICDNKLAVGFIGNYLPSQDVMNWLPTIKANYPNVNEIIIL